MLEQIWNAILGLTSQLVIPDWGVLVALGLVFGGLVMALGTVALVLTLLYWLAEGLRIYDHDVARTTTVLPVTTHDGPPPGVHMPGPSWRPIVGALGTALLLLGLVFGEW